MLLDADHFNYDAEKREYVQEASQLRGELHSVPREFTLTNCPEPGMSRSFRQSRVDTSGGDVAGWWFEELPGPNRGAVSLKVLLIND